MKRTTFLMFEGAAEAARKFYVSPFPNSRVLTIDRDGRGQPGTGGIAKIVAFELRQPRLNRKPVSPGNSICPDPRPLH